MSFLNRTACLFLVVGAVTASSACTKAPGACSPESEGYGDATGLLWSTLVEVDRADGACRPRVEMYSTGADLRRATDELEIRDVPFVDFARERVVVREAPNGRTLAWMAARGEKVTVGTQACIGTVAEGCHVHFYRVTTAGGTSADEHVCPEIGCGGVQSDPGG